MMYDKNFIDGGRYEEYLKECSEDIKSKDITMFSYEGNNCQLYAKKEGNVLNIKCSGGGQYNQRDGSLFSIKYETNDLSILKILQEIIDEYHETRQNGYCLTVDGLPPGIGDTLNVEYKSGEKIYKTSNQFPVVTLDAFKKFYDIFHEYVKKEGYDFNTKGSNVKLFDDADEEYLQGTWKGKHFGEKIEVTFNKNRVTIKVNDKVVDDNVEYVICDGLVRKNKVKEGIEKATSRYDYEEFDAISSISKHNYFTLDAYFCKKSYSKCELFNFDKEKPKE